MNDKNYRDLADNIILQAVKDYRKTLKKVIKHPFKREYLWQKRSLERFFYSNWFKTLTDIDGKKLVRDLKAEVN